MKNKNGFTLIELLAIIILLGIIGVIAIPSIKNTLDETRIESLKVSINSLERSVINDCKLKVLDGNKIYFDYTIENSVITPDVDFNGKLPVSGIVKVHDNCVVDIFLYDEKYCGVKENGQVSVTESTKDECIVT